MSDLVKRLRINAKDCGRYIEDEAADRIGEMEEEKQYIQQLVSAHRDELDSRISHLEAKLKRLGSKESMTLQILVGDVERKFDYKKEYFTRIEYANEELK